MVNRYPLWKNLLVLLVAALAMLYAAPNLFRPDPAVQISSDTRVKPLDEKDMARLDKRLRSIGIQPLGMALDDGGALVRLREEAEQLPAKDAAEALFGGNYIVALNRAETTPPWLKRLGAQSLNLGLDLSGGVHFLLEVDTEAYIDSRVLNFSEDLRLALVRERVRGSVRYLKEAQSVRVSFSDEPTLERGLEVLRENQGELQPSVERGAGNYSVTLQLPSAARTEFENYAVEQNLTIMRNRVNELGVAEPLVQRQGRRRIVVELPGVQNTAQAKRVLGKFANLEFRLQAKPNDSRLLRERFEFRDDNAGRPVWLLRELIAKGDNVTSARAGFDENGRPMVAISLDSAGGSSMNLATRDNIGRGMGVLFIERRVRTAEDRGSDALRVAIGEKYDQKKIISLATIRSALGSRFQIEGLDSIEESTELALLLRAGALSAPLEFVEERTVGPSLGRENIRKGMMSVIVGLSLVLLFMLLWYRGFGVAANTALLFNLLMLLAVMSLLSATLTLPGIAGIVLTVGMAVDANVLIYSRIKEEIKRGLNTQSAIFVGYQRAVITILDANITTLLVALILYIVGTGPVRGFAVTLSIGILTSMFSAIIGTRALVNLIYGRRSAPLRIGGLPFARASMEAG